MYKHINFKFFSVSISVSTEIRMTPEIHVSGIRICFSGSLKITQDKDFNIKDVYNEAEVESSCGIAEGVNYVISPDTTKIITAYK